MTASAVAALFSAGCAQLPAAPAAQLDRARIAEIDGAINAVIADRRMPGALFHLERNGDSYERAYGRLSYDADAAPVDTGTLFDAASLTKILATAPSVLLLAEQGKIDLEAPLSRYFPECGGKGKDGMTIRHLLTHSSGLPAGLAAKPAWEGQAAAHALACAKDVTDKPGTAFRYSDINYILLGQLVQLVSGMPLDQFAQRHIFTPLGMTDTGFLPLARFGAARIAPTHVSPLLDDDKALHPGLAHGAVLQGVVHDPTARRMGGVAGSAGVFTTTRDVARFARMLLAGGALDGVRILGADSVRLMTTVQSPAGVAQTRGMGMDIDSPFATRPRGALFPVGSYGHTGFTGCILWIEPSSHTFYVLLSNRVYPDDKSNILPLYDRLGTLAAQSVLGVDFPAPEADYKQIGRLIYGSTRLEGELAAMMQSMARSDAERAQTYEHDLALRAAGAAAMFDRLALDAGTKAEFKALMDKAAGLGVHGGRQAQTLLAMSPGVLAARNADLAAVQAALPRFSAMAAGR
ncbi:MAG: serine hydrolase [Pseudomonadota bacterium]|nr:serine hydrolase [Pseudomonadota bacterium]